MGMKSWIQTLSKDKLARFAVMYEIDTSGTLDDIRQRVRAYIDEHAEEFSHDAPPPGTSNPRRESRTTVAPPPIPFEFEDIRITHDASILNQIRKWGCHFDGRDPVAFLERVDELRAAYGYSDEQLLRGLPELLRGDALIWSRNNRDNWIM